MTNKYLPTLVLPLSVYGCVFRPSVLVVVQLVCVTFCGTLSAKQNWGLYHDCVDRSMVNAVK